jgi:hypothetical protein
MLRFLGTETSYSSVGIVTDYSLDDRDSIADRAGDFALLHRVQTDPEAYPVPYKMGTGSLFPGGKSEEAWSSPLTKI